MPPDEGAFASKACGKIYIKFNREFSNCPKQQKTRPIDKYDEYNEDDGDVAYSGDADDNYNDDDDSGDEDVEDGTEMHDLSGEPRAAKLSTNCFKLTF